MVLRKKNPPFYPDIFTAKEEVGFVDKSFVDMTDSRSAFVKARDVEFLEKKESFVEIHCMDAFESLSHFFNAMNTITVIASVTAI